MMSDRPGILTSTHETDSVDEKQTRGELNASREESRCSREVKIDVDPASE